MKKVRPSGQNVATSVGASRENLKDSPDSRQKCFCSATQIFKSVATVSDAKKRWCDENRYEFFDEKSIAEKSLSKSEFRPPTGCNVVFKNISDYPKIASMNTIML